MAFKTISVKTESAQQLVDITQQVRLVVRESGVISGVCRVFIPHTTAAVTINENADPNVRRPVATRTRKPATVKPRKSAKVETKTVVAAKKARSSAAGPRKRRAAR